MDSIEIIYYDLEDEKREYFSKIDMRKKEGFIKGGRFMDFRLNGKSLKEIIEENIRNNFFNSYIFNLGTGLYFKELDYTFLKILMIRLLGNKVKERDIIELFTSYNNLNYSLEEIRNLAKIENQNLVNFLVCRLCGDYGCGVGQIFVENKGDTILWDLSPFHDNVENENFQYKYEFDIIEYIYELYSFEKYFTQLLEKNKKYS